MNGRRQRWRWSAVWLVSLALLTGRPTGAQERPFPYTLSRQDLLLLPASVGISALGTSVAGRPGSVTLEEIQGLRPDQVNPFDRGATGNWSFTWDERSDEYRDTLIRAGLILLFVPDALHLRFTRTVTVGTMLAESYFLLRGTAYLTKGLVGRRRPWLYNTSMTAEERFLIASGDQDDARHSFFSGHSAVAFFLATFTSQVTTEVYGRSAWTDLLWGASLSVAALTAHARVRAGMHYPSDVAAGALVGFAIGRLVPALHRGGAGKGGRPVAFPGGIGLCWDLDRP